MKAEPKFEMCLRPEVRPIYYKGKKALFHQWAPFSSLVGPSMLRGGHDGGVISGTLAIIETADGMVHEVYPADIQFADPGYQSQVWNTQRIRPMKEGEGND